MPARGTHGPALLAPPLALPLPRHGYGVAGGARVCVCSHSWRAARSAPTEAPTAPAERCAPQGREKDKITCALAEGAAEKSSFLLIWKPTIRSLQSLLFVEAIILRGR